MNECPQTAYIHLHHWYQVEKEIVRETFIIHVKFIKTILSS